MGPLHVVTKGGGYTLRFLLKARDVCVCLCLCLVKVGFLFLLTFCLISIYS